MDNFLTPEAEEMSPEELQQLMELGVIPSKMDALKDQMGLAEALRYGEGPQGRDSGRVYTAANPLEHLVHAANGIKAGKDLEDLRTKQNSLLDKQVQGRSAFINALRRKRNPIQLDSQEDDLMAMQMPTGSF